MKYNNVVKMDAIFIKLARCLQLLMLNKFMKFLLLQKMSYFIKLLNKGADADTNADIRNNSAISVLSKNNFYFRRNRLGSRMRRRRKRQRKRDRNSFIYSSNSRDKNSVIQKDPSTINLNGVVS